MADFSEQIKQFREKTDKNTDIVFKNSCQQVSETIAERTGVSTGSAIGQWSPSIGTPVNHDYAGGPSAWSVDTEGGWEKDEGIAATNKANALANLYPRIQSVTGQLTKDFSYYFTNHTSYIRQIEYEGWLKTGPYFMIARTKGEFSLIVNAMAEALNV